MTDNLENENQILLAPVVENIPENNEFFTINSQKAAEILGVNRTRLSQLTSQGVFPYERRKVESRSRLFYRLNDLLNYQRKSSFGNLSAETIQTKALVPFAPPSVSTVSANTENKPPTSIRIKNEIFKQPRIKTSHALQKASDLKLLQTERLKNETLNVTVMKLELHMQNILQAITNLEIAITKLKKSKSLSRKKVVFNSPRMKRLFKRIKS